MKIGILGCGYVGTMLASSLYEKGHSLHLTTTSQEKVIMLEDFATQVHVLKVSHSAHLGQFLDQIEALFITIAPSQGTSYEETYLACAKAIRESLKHHGQNITFIGYTSTTSVYGHHDGAWVDETSSLHAVSPNSQCLVKAEQIYQLLQNDSRRVCILRLGEIYGPGRELEGRVRKMSGSSLPGKGSSYCNLTHVDDIVGALEFCMDHSLSGIYNLCNHTHMTRDNLYTSICRYYGWPAPNWDKTDSKASFKQNKRVSSSKIESLGFRFQHPFAFDWLSQSSQNPGS
jgi:nucleoside-diphosphate-sugar epimerase